MSATIRRLRPSASDLVVVTTTAILAAAYGASTRLTIAADGVRADDVVASSLPSGPFVTLGVVCPWLLGIALRHTTVDRVDVLLRRGSRLRAWAHQSALDSALALAVVAAVAVGLLVSALGLPVGERVEASILPGFARIVAFLITTSAVALAVRLTAGRRAELTTLVAVGVWATVTVYLIPRSPLSSRVALFPAAIEEHTTLTAVLLSEAGIIVGAFAAVTVREAAADLRMRGPHPLPSPLPVVAAAAGSAILAATALFAVARRVAVDAATGLVFAAWGIGGSFLQALVWITMVVGFALALAIPVARHSRGYRAALLIRYGSNVRWRLRVIGAVAVTSARVSAVAVALATLAAAVASGTPIRLTTLVVAAIVTLGLTASLTTAALLLAAAASVASPSVLLVSTIVLVVAIVASPAVPHSPLTAGSAGRLAPGPVVDLPHVAAGLAIALVVTAASAVALLAAPKGVR